MNYLILIKEMYFSRLTRLSARFSYASLQPKALGSKLKNLRLDPPLVYTHCLHIYD